MGYDREPVSLDQTVGPDGESVLGDFVAHDARAEIADTVADGQLRTEVEIVLSTLSRREQEVIRLRFGLDDGRDPHARGGGPGVRPVSRADPPDREGHAAQAADAGSGQRLEVFAS